MKLGIVWLDSHKSDVYKFTSGEMSVEHFEAKSIDHHHSNPRDDLKNKKMAEQLYSDVLNSVKEYQHLILMGPGTSKNQFKHYCEEHSAQVVAKKIQNVETTKEHFNEKEAKERAEQFFKHHFAFAKMNT